MLGFARRTGLIGLALAAVLAPAFDPGGLSGLQKPSNEKSRREEAPAEHEFHEEARISFDTPAPSVVDGGVKCDQTGDVYVVYGSGAPEAALSLPYGAQSLPIRRVSRALKTVTLYGIQSIPNYGSIQRVDFDVDGRGIVYALVSASRHLADEAEAKKEYTDSLVVRFAGDGTVDSVEKLDSPRAGHLTAQRFAAYWGGNFLVTGVLYLGWGRPGRPFTGIYDTSGRLVRELELPHDAGPTPRSEGGSSNPAAPVGDTGEAKAEGEKDQQSSREKVSWQQAVGAGYMVGAPDGNVYLLRAAAPPRIYAVSPSGELVREIEVKLPKYVMEPFGMSLWGEKSIFISFVHAITGDAGEDSQYHELFAVVDVDTGQLTATYRLPHDANLMAGCATSGDRFLFLGSTKDAKLEVVELASR